MPVPNAAYASPAACVASTVTHAGALVAASVWSASAVNAAVLVSSARPVSHAQAEDERVGASGLAVTATGAVVAMCNVLMELVARAEATDGYAFVQLAWENFAAVGGAGACAVSRVSAVGIAQFAHVLWGRAPAAVRALRDAGVDSSVAAAGQVAAAFVVSFWAGDAGVPV